MLISAGWNLAAEIDSRTCSFKCACTLSVFKGSSREGELCEHFIAFHLLARAGKGKTFVVFHESKESRIVITRTVRKRPVYSTTANFRFPGIKVILKDSYHGPSKNV